MDPSTRRRMRHYRLLSALAIVLASISCAAGNDAHMERELEQLQEAVRHAEADAHKAHSKKDVVDLGASLRIVEDRFAGLRAALLSEMGGPADAKGGAPDIEQHAKDLSKVAMEMVDKLGKSRSEVHAVLAEVRTMDTATAELKGAITKLETEISELGKALQQAHVDSHVLSSAHSDLRASVRDVHSRSAALDSTKVHGYVPKWYYIVLLEFVVLVLFGAYKVYVVRRKDKFSKLG